MVTSAMAHAAFAPSPRHRPGDTTRVHASRHVRTRHTRVVRTAAWASSSRQPWVVLASSSSSSSNDGHDRFAFVRPGIDPDPRRRADIQIGSDVDVIRKEDQRSGSTTRGVVREFLTNSATHPQGLKVRLVDGTIGRVARVHAGKTEVASSKPGGAESADNSEKKNGADERRRRGASQKPKEARGASSGGDASSKAKNNSNASPRNTNSNQTVYLSNIPKALGKKDVAWLLEELPGVTGVRLPRRGGKNMGYAFVLTQDVQVREFILNFILLRYVRAIGLTVLCFVSYRARIQSSIRSAGWSWRGRNCWRSSRRNPRGNRTRDVRTKDRRRITRRRRAARIQTRLTTREGGTIRAAKTAKTK